MLYQLSYSRLVAANVVRPPYSPISTLPDLVAQAGISTS